MSKWEDAFKKTTTYDNGTHECRCMSDRGVFIPNRQLSAIIAALLFLVFTVFISGYFLGKKYAAEQFTAQMQKNSFTDQVYASVVSTAMDTTLAQNKNYSSPSDSTDGLHDLVVTHSQSVPSLEVNTSHSYYAQLIGFGTEKAAQQFVAKLAAKGVITEVKKRTSKTAKGRVSYWYQVVTAQYTDQHELATIVDKIAKEENLKDVCMKEGILA